MPVQSKSGKIINGYQVLAACVLIFSSCVSQKIIPPPPTTEVKKDSLWMKLKATIDGVVSFNSQPVSNAEIFFENELVATTDVNGKFSFEQSFDEYPRFHLLTVKAKGFSEVKRNFHPSMQSTTYHIILGDHCCLTSITARNHTPQLQIRFDNKTMQLDGEAEHTLIEIATSLRQDPTAKIEVLASGNSGAEKALALYRQQAIRNYLADKEGISPDRVIFKMEDASKNVLKIRTSH